MNPHDRAWPEAVAGARLVWCACGLLLLLLPPPAVAADDGRWRQREFVIGGWYTGDPYRPARLMDFWGAGLNRIVNGERSDRLDVELTAHTLDSLTRAVPGFDLELIAKLGNMPDSVRTFHNPDANIHRAAIARMTAPGTGVNHPSMDGWLVWDEPSGDDFRAVGHTIALLDSLPSTRRQLAFVNLLPPYASGQRPFDLAYGTDKQAAYRRYLEDFIAMYRRIGVPVPLIAADHYPFEVPGRAHDVFFCLRTLVAAAAVCDSTPPPVWVTIQLAPRRDRSGRYRAEPAFAGVRWQASVSIAYGAKGILYWTLVPPASRDYGAGLLDPNGVRSANFDSVRALDRVLRHWGPTLMRLTPVSVLHQSVSGAEAIEYDRFDAPAAGGQPGASTEPPAGGATPARSDPFGGPWRPASAVAALTGGDEQGMVGTLLDRAAGEDYLIVVNKSLTRPESFAVTLAAATAGVERIGDDGTSRPVGLTGRRFEVPPIPPGGAAMYRLRAR